MRISSVSGRGRIAAGLLTVALVATPPVVVAIPSSATTRTISTTTVGAPTNLRVTPGRASVTVAFTTPVLPAGVSVRNVSVSTSTNGGRSWSTWRAAKPADRTSPVTFTGLANNVPTRARIRLSTSAGASATSRPSAVFVPGVPAPTTSTTTTSTTSTTPTTVPTPPPTTGVELVVSRTGNDDAAGTRAAPLRTLTEAWARIPRNVTLTQPHTITMLPGTYAESTIPNYLEWRRGSASAPITLRADQPGRGVTLLGDLNIFEVHFLRVQGIRIAPGGDAFHCERCTNLTLDDVELDGTGGAWETLKINQSADIVIRNSTLRAAGDNVIDFVAVQRGSITGNVISGGGDWCMYVKGGSTGIDITDNQISNCGTGGFTAGQGTGLEFMVEPWLTWEATDIVFARNRIFDVEGAAFGVNGGRNILLEDNWAERVGRRSHLLEVTFGMRSCDGNALRCATLLAAGAWGTATVGGDVYAHIPNRNVVIRNNVIINPTGYRSLWQHLEISNPRTNASPRVGPSPARTDDGLVIAGNVIVNGDTAMPLGIEGTDVCTPTNPTCTVAQIWRDNDINGR